ncbi:hypothetical protein [Marinibactrum halimedae]|uniref:Uncharacterized protein n=1 Tax=Marinibactrum halimedae TaxID=1444977 RepID=A0AA37T7L9_9GAMM|nr:hypothetical protein [Marinibactrum halimedae]MCD9459200.1 hypothetical protein [Marinibactrum halimedae]GLS27271.1 hypothetical protein GCM10007877_29900 [Marinibactrum halimedae]
MFYQNMNKAAIPFCLSLFSSAISSANALLIETPDVTNTSCQIAVFSEDADKDGVGIVSELLYGTNPCQEDTDGDFINDAEDPFPLHVNFTSDHDLDGLPDEWEREHNIDDPYADEDNDFVSNALEFQLGTNPIQVDSDLDGQKDNTDKYPLNALYYLDNDNDGLPDEWEAIHRLDPLVNDAADDADFDGLTNLQEFQRGTEPRNNDTDNDRIYDGQDCFPLDRRYRKDSDKDGLPDRFENNFANAFIPLDPLNPNDALADMDRDQVSNLDEFLSGTLLTEANSDWDLGFIDFIIFEEFEYDQQDVEPLNRLYTVDVDQDGMPRRWEIRFGLNDDDSSDATVDIDGDAFTNLQEYKKGMDPTLFDTDADGIDDGLDAFPTNPLYQFDDDSDGIPNAYEDDPTLGLSSFYAGDASEDFDNDGLNNLREFQAGTDIYNADSDYDRQSGLPSNN